MPPNLDLDGTYADDDDSMEYPRPRCGRVMHEEPKPGHYRTPGGWFDEDAYEEALAFYIRQLQRKLR